MNPEPRDWRRRRSSTSPNQSPAETPVDSPGAAVESRTGEEDSRTLFSLLEPILDVIGTYRFPMVIAGVIALFSGLVVVLFVSSMRLYGAIDIIVGLVLVGTVALIFLSSVTAAFLSRTGRYGVNSTIMVAAFIGITLLIGIITFEKNERFDLTATNQFSLNSRTEQILDDLDRPIQATAFYKDLAMTLDQDLASRRIKVEDTLKEFNARSGKFTFRVVDPDLNPDVAATYFKARRLSFVAESVVVESLESEKFDVVRRTDDAYSQLEQDLVTGILVATEEEQKAVYFLAGHGERSVTNTGPDGYSMLREGLERDNYRVETLTWSASSEDVKVPEDAGLLVIPRPTGEIPVSHAQALDRYLQGVQLKTVTDSTGNSVEQLVDRLEGGRVIFLADVDTDITFRQFIARWGVGIATGYILDQSSSDQGNPLNLILNTFNPDSVVLDIVEPEGVPLGDISMPSATALLPQNDGQRNPIILAATSGNSYLIQDLERTKPITDEGDNSDPRDIFIPALLIEDGLSPVGMQAPGSRSPLLAYKLVVFGDSDFVSNSFFGRDDGSDLFLNSANYLLGDFSLVSIREKVFPFREFKLNRNEFNFVRWTSWLFLPGLMGLMAALVWWVRR